MSSYHESMGRKKVVMVAAGILLPTHVKWYDKLYYREFLIVDFCPLLLYDRPVDVWFHIHSTYNTGRLYDAMKIVTHSLNFGLLLCKISFRFMDLSYYPPELFQIQMGLSFPFLRANDLRLSLLNIRARIFLISCT